MTDYPIDEIFRRAKLGELAVYPPKDEFGYNVFGADVYDKPRRFLLLDDIVLLPPQFTPERLEKGIELLREPLYIDVNTESVVGGFKVKMPVVCAAMGGTHIANLIGPKIAEACAEMGIIYSLGENIASIRGYDERLTKQPSFKERAFSYLRNLNDGYGGLVIQQSVEDENLKLWERVYTDPDFDPYIEEGLIAFEIKIGQGAKPGLGGEVLVSRDVALRIKDSYYIPEDPEKVVKDYYEKHSAPGTFTEDILASQIRLIKNNFPRIKVFLKTGPYRDLDSVIEIAAREGIDAITIDGKEGGTGMSPIAGMRDLGLPTVSCLSAITRAKEKGINTSFIISGRLYDGSHVVKSLALGADAVAFGRPMVYSCLGSIPLAQTFIKNELFRYTLLRELGKLALNLGIKGERCKKGVVNYLKSVQNEVKMLTSALGKYYMHRLSKEDVGALRRELAGLFGIRYVYDRGCSPLLEKKNIN